LRLTATYDVDSTVDIDVDLRSSSSTSRPWPSCERSVTHWLRRPTVCFTRQSRCKVNERVDVIVAVNVKVLVKVIVEVIVEDKVERSGSASVLLAATACDRGSVACATPYPVEPVRRRTLICAREHAGGVRSKHPRTATVQSARADIRRQRRTCPPAGRHG
jgi:hypothetical protein